LSDSQEPAGKPCGAAHTATHAAESCTRSGVQKTTLGYTPPPDHPGTQLGKRSPVAAALINNAPRVSIGTARSSVCTPAEALFVVSSEPLIDLGLPSNPLS
jgi:hypothetical protein